MSDINEPDAATVRTSVDRVEGDVLQGIRTNRLRRRRITVAASVLAGIGLFAGGVAVGGAALTVGQHPPTPSWTVRDAHGHVISNVFAVDCYGSLSARSPESTGLEVPPSDAAARRDPAAICRNISDDPAQPTATCTVTRNWAAVYPRGTQAAEEVCDHLGYSVWGD